MKKKTESAPQAAPKTDPIVVKIMQQVRPGDVVFIEMNKPTQASHLKHIAEQFKAMLPNVHCVILNGDARVTKVQTLATIADDVDA